MATEVGKLVIELQARVDKMERGLRRGSRSILSFQRRSTRSFRTIGRAFGRLVKRFSGLTFVIAGLAGAFGFAQFVRASIDASAAVETFRIRLQTLIGSQKEAAQTLENLRVVATKVAPSLRDIIEAAATLGSVALGSSEKIERLTGTALNIAAVTGLTLVQASQNLQRALSAGIGAADLFRERGVRAIVEALTGVPNLVAQPLSVVAKAMDDVFGEGGTFGMAAEQFAFTLPGTISITRDALFNLQQAFGDALKPAVVSGLRELIIPALESLMKTVVENKDSVKDFARRGILFLVKAFVIVGKGAVKLVAFLSDLSGAVGEFQIRMSKTKQFVNTVRLAFNALTSDSEDMVKALKDIGENSEEIKRLEAAQVAAADKARKLNAELAVLEEGLNDVAAIADKFGDTTGASFEKANEDAEEMLKTLQKLLKAAADPLDPKLLAQVQSSQNAIQRAIERRAVAELKAVEPITAGTVKLQQQAQALETRLIPILQQRAALERQIGAQRQGLALAKEEEDQKAILALTGLERVTRGEILKVDRVIASARGEQVRIASKIASENERMVRLRRDEVTLQDEFNTKLEIARDLDAKQTEIIARRLETRLDEAVGIEERVDAVKRSIESLDRIAIKKADDFAEDMGKAVTRSLTDAIITAANGGAPEFGKIIANIAGSFLEKALMDAMEPMAEGLTSLLKKVKIGTGEIGDERADILSSSLIGIAGFALSRAFDRGGGEVTSAAVQSAVDSSQKIRGVVAGPTSIAIAQVDRAISDSFVETNSELRRQTVLLRDIADGGGAVAGEAGEEGASSEEVIVLSGASPSFT